MANTSNKIEPRKIFYYRSRFKNRVFGEFLSFFVKEAERTGVSKKDIADRLGRDPSQITRWLSNPSNLTLETISDLSLALNAEPDPPKFIPFTERRKRNYMHPWVAHVLGAVSTAKTGATEMSVSLETSSKPQAIQTDIISSLTKAEGQVIAADGGPVLTSGHV